MKENMMKKIPILKYTIGLMILVALGACNMPATNGSSTEEISAQEAAMTSAAQTVAAQHTANAQDATTTDEDSTEEPDDTESPEVTPTSTEVPCDLAGFVKDVTIVDGTEMTPGEVFTKTWQVRNEGSCTWTSGYELIFDEGDIMGGTSPQQLTSASIPPGDILDVSVELTAPGATGTYRGLWHIRNPQGDIFTRSGIWVEIVVVPAPPSVHSSHASFDIAETAEADLDEGDSPPAGGGRDFTFTANGTKFIKAENGATILLMDSNEPSYTDCKTVVLTSDSIEVDDALIDQWVCYRTNQGRVGKFKVVSLTPGDPNAAQTLEISYTTWAIP
jgi:hypothetical protein